MVVGKRQSLVDKRAKALGMIGAAMVFFFKDNGTIMTHSYRAHIGARVNVQYTRHNSFNLNKVQIYAFFLQFLYFCRNLTSKLL